MGSLQTDLAEAQGGLKEASLRMTQQVWGVIDDPCPHLRFTGSKSVGHEQIVAKYCFTSYQAARGEAVSIGLREELASSQRELAASEGACKRAEKRASDLTEELRALREVMII